MTPYQTYAVMVLCARDVDVIWHRYLAGGNPTLPPAGAAEVGYITAANWRAMAQLRCDDLIISKGLNCYYGLVLACTADIPPFNAGDYLVAVRGTMDALEWLNDALAEAPKSASGVTGQVSAGFWDIYASMTLNGMDGALLGDNAALAVSTLIKKDMPAEAEVLGATVYVTGHSLGAALATYLTADLSACFAGSAVSLDPYVFASPKPGTQDYVWNYQQSVGAYTLVNYAQDIVPKLPTTPPGAALLAGGPTHDVHIISPGAPGAPPSSLDPLISLPNNHSPVYYARMLDPANAVAAGLAAP